jgi:uncharacterized protein YprB with RNaseH-like and TPR domain
VSGNLQERLSRIAALKPLSRSNPVERNADERGNTLATIGAEVGRNRYGEYLFARQWHARPEVCETNDEVLRLLLPVAAECPERTIWRAADPSKWLFLDTETTGLAGGTGTYAFLVGLAWWESGGIQIEQLFMRDHNEEHSILLELADRLSERPVLVTFNGKCFDWPLLQNRFRMTRQIALPELAAHLDFLHPARQLWRLQFNSMRLADLERHVLGAESLDWSRREDIDSSRIPEYYFDFLRGGSAENVAGVFRHNRMDLRGLAALAGRILRTLANFESPVGDQAPLELYAISRLLNRRGERLKARRACERSLGAGLPEPIARRARHELARLAKRELDFGRAFELWNQLADSSEPSFEALEQLAIHYERRERNYGEAARVSRLALAELRRASRLGIASQRDDRVSARLQRRLMRLEAKSRQGAASWKHA